MLRLHRALPEPAFPEQLLRFHKLYISNMYNHHRFFDVIVFFNTWSDRKDWQQVLNKAYTKTYN